MASAATAAGPMKAAHMPHLSSSDQAVTSASQSDRPRAHNSVLDSNQKLSAAGAAASLKFASPRDLPSYPSAGLKNSDFAAGKAANLGWASQKPVELWKPDPSASASAAAVLAKDYKMAPLWKPEQSTNGARAAVLAHKDTAKVEPWKPEANTWGNSAANEAFKKNREKAPAAADTRQPDLNRQKSLLAATGAMSNSRKRAVSNPTQMAKAESYPDEANASANALKAATSAARSPRRSPALPEGGSVPFTAMSREMYTSHPPVAPEVEDQHHNDVLRASAVAMAKKMYSQQQKQSEVAKSAHHGAAAAHGRHHSMTSAGEDLPSFTFTDTNLQEAAQRLAQERLAKVYAEHQQFGEMQDYYGVNRRPSKLTIKGMTRRRSSSDTMLDDDRKQSDRIRAEMSIFSSNLSQVDAKKRQQEREALIAAAQRNVTNKLHSMDEKVFADTGRITPSMLSDWEIKAHAAAQANSSNREDHEGKVDIGGGKYMDQADVDAIAAKNIQPLLDEINDKAEKERDRQAALKADAEEKQRKAEAEKARNKEVNEINKKMKQQEKEERKAKKNEEKATKAEEKRLAKERRKSGTVDAPQKSPTSARSGDEPSTPAAAEQRPSTPVKKEVKEHQMATIPGTLAPVQRTSMEMEGDKRIQHEADRANPEESTPLSPGSPNSKVKNWFMNRFSRRLSRSKSATNTTGEEKAFIGGAALTGGATGANTSSTSLDAHQSSMREVAMAGKNQDENNDDDEQRIGRPATRDSTVSSLSSDPHTARSSLHTDPSGEEDTEHEEARDTFDEDLAPPPTFLAVKSSSPARDSKFREVID